MTKNEIERHLVAGSTKSVKVDVSLVDEYPGFVRTVTIADGNEVRVDFEQYGYDEAGAYFKARFESLDDAIQAVERYLNKQLSDWTNFTKTGEYPEAAGEMNTKLGDERLRSAIASGTLQLPEPARYRIGGARSWVSIAPAKWQ
jgi:hypothetical protein